MIILAKISIIEWLIIALGLLLIGGYIAYSIYRKKHPKKKKDDDDE